MMGGHEDAERRAAENSAAMSDLESRIADIDRRILMKAEDHANDIVALQRERRKLRAQQEGIALHAIATATSRNVVTKRWAQ